jgi:DNA-binding NtrC family response regulator
VDDEPVIAHTVASILRLNGFQVKSFTDPLQALASALAEPPHLLLSDVVMPNLSGLDLAVQVQALCPECKVLLFSGQADTVSFVQDADKVGANFHILPKPLFPADLLGAIREQFEAN